MSDIRTLFIKPSTSSRKRKIGEVPTVPIESESVAERAAADDVAIFITTDDAELPDDAIEKESTESSLINNEQVGNVGLIKSCNTGTATVMSVNMLVTRFFWGEFRVSTLCTVIGSLR